MIRVASKADLMVIDEIREKIKYLEVSAKYYNELIKLMERRQELTSTSEYFIQIPATPSPPSTSTTIIPS